MLVEGRGATVEGGEVPVEGGEVPVKDGGVPFEGGTAADAVESSLSGPLAERESELRPLQS